MTAADPDPATLDAVERELRAAFGLLIPTALAESRAASAETIIDPDEATAAAALAEAAPYFYVDPSSLRRPPMARASAGGLSPTSAEAAEASRTESAPLREPAVPRRSGRAFGEGTPEQRLERLEIAIREVKR